MVVGAAVGMYVCCGGMYCGVGLVGVGVVFICCCVCIVCVL